MAKHALDDMSEARLPAVIDGTPAGGPRDHSLHVDADAICPRCLAWIGPEDFVRRNGWGLAQHETCPVAFQIPAAPAATW